MESYKKNKLIMAHSSKGKRALSVALAELSD